MEDRCRKFSDRCRHVVDRCRQVVDRCRHMIQRCRSLSTKVGSGCRLSTTCRQRRKRCRHRNRQICESTKKLIYHYLPSERVEEFRNCGGKNLNISYFLIVKIRNNVIIFIYYFYIILKIL